MINPKCDKCGDELQAFGGLAFSPPLPSERGECHVDKIHVCSKCWKLFLDWLIVQADGSLTVPEAQRRRVCRICKIDDRPHPPNNPFVLNYGKEYAHEQCLKQNSEALRPRTEDV